MIEKCGNYGTKNDRKQLSKKRLYQGNGRIIRPLHRQSRDYSTSTTTQWAKGTIYTMTTAMMLPKLSNDWLEKALSSAGLEDRTFELKDLTLAIERSLSGNLVQFKFQMI